MYNINLQCNAILITKTIQDYCTVSYFLMVMVGFYWCYVNNTISTPAVIKKHNITITLQKMAKHNDAVDYYNGIKIKKKKTYIYNDIK